MTDTAPNAAWTERLADRSPSVQRSRSRSVEQARVLIDAARRLITSKGESFTTQELIKEAGVALQTFYRYFGGKDALLLAVLEDMITEAAEQYAERASRLDGPVERLRSHLEAVVEQLDGHDISGPTRRFIAAEHWRLSQAHPDEVARATKPFVDLVEAEIIAANEVGLLTSEDPSRDAWFVNQLVLSVFHHHSFASSVDPTLADDLWRFTIRALGGTTEPAPARGKATRTQA